MNFILVTSFKNLNDYQLLDNDFVTEQLKKIFDISNLEKIYFLRPVNNKYTIDDIRSFLINNYYTSTKLKHKLFIIYNFELFSDIHQNFILKTLEESKHIFVLVTNSIHKILPTVISRCITLHCQTNEVSSIDDFSDLLSIKQVKEMLKSNITRDELLDFLNKLICSNQINNFEYVLALDKAIKLLDSNCSVKSTILYLWSVLNRYYVQRNSTVS